MQTHTQLGLRPASTWLSTGNSPMLIAGPCSAESPEQLLETALALSSLGVGVMRMGIWKPRTRPGSFEGFGEEALAWLAPLKQVAGMHLITEVATAAQVELALAAGFDKLWLGARTTVNPFLVQEIAEALRGVQVPVMVKNPINPELSLWVGALERLQRVGITELAACHRGFSLYGERKYRNAPVWEIPLELRRLHPQLPLIGDPSHITGARTLVPEVAQRMLNLGYDGLMVEVHPDPDNARSDAAQQLTPAAFGQMLRELVFTTPDAPDLDYHRELTQLRAQVDELDQEMLRAVARRLEIARQIGQLKQEKGVQFFQSERYREIFESRTALATELGLSKAFVEQMVRLLHLESLDKQG